MAITREIQIAYGSYVLGGDTGRHTDGPLRIERDFERGSVEFTVVVGGDTADALADECAAIEAAFRIPYQDLTVAYGGYLLVRASQDSNTGFDARPSITKVGDPGDSGRRRFYRVRVEYGLPADNVENSGLRKRTVEVSYSPSRRATVTIRGEYTAVETNDARAEYAARIASLATAIMSSLSISTYELVSEVAGPSSTNEKTLEFERIYREIVQGQGSDSATNDSAVVEQSIVIARRIDAPGDTGANVKRLRTLDVRYSASIDKTVSTDLEGKWTSLRSWVVTKVQTFAGGSVGVVSERLSLDYDENRITVEMVVLAQVGSEKLEYRLTVQDVHQTGTRLVPAWDGNRFSRYLFQGPSTYLRRISTVTRYAGTRGVGDAYAEAVALIQDHSAVPQVDDAQGAKWDHRDTRVDARQLRLGDTEAIDVTDVTADTVLELYVPVNLPAITPSGGF